MRKILTHTRDTSCSQNGSIKEQFDDSNVSDNSSVRTVVCKNTFDNEIFVLGQSQEQKDNKKIFIGNKKSE